MRYKVEIIVRQKHFVYVDADDKGGAKDKALAEIDWSRVPEDIDQEVSVFEADEEAMRPMKLTKRHYGELINLALNDRPGWVPLGPMEAARRRRLKGPYSRPNILADLEREALINLFPGTKGQTATIRLTQAGKDLISVMPDDLHHDGLFPLPCDIAKAKAKVK